MHERQKMGQTFGLAATVDPKGNRDTRGQLSDADLNILSRYEIISELGRGGMARVYRARHRELDLDVAIKVCLPGQNLERFRHEARTLASIRSHFIVAVHDFELLPNSRAALIMDWIDGQDLKQVMDATYAPVQEDLAKAWMIHVCHGMQEASSLGIVHRDLKPSNVLINKKNHAFVSDFGLARSRSVTGLTNEENILGTVYYMAPEQAEDPRTVDTRADIYSYGATFYHVLTGTVPFKGETPFSVLLKHKTEPLTPPKARNPALSNRMNECLERCMAKSPQNRFSTFGQILKNLQAVQSDSTPWEATNDADLKRYIDLYQERRSIYLNQTSGELSGADVYELPGGREIHVGFGNLTEQNVDALVSSDDGALTMGGGVSAALLAAAGPSLKREAQRYAPVRAGRAVVTSAGDLPTRFVFHAITLGVADQRRALPSRDLILDLMESCFYHADTLRLSSIAFPLLGTGAGRFSPSVCLDTMFRFLVQKLLRAATDVRTAKIVLWRG